jgi:hypothetical protein
MSIPRHPLHAVEPAPAAGHEVTLSVLPDEIESLVMALLARVAAREASPVLVLALVILHQLLHLARHGRGIVLARPAVGDGLHPVEEARLAPVRARAILPFRGADVAPLASAETGWSRWSVCGCMGYVMGIGAHLLMW